MDGDTNLYNAAVQNYSVLFSCNFAPEIWELCSVSFLNIVGLPACTKEIFPVAAVGKRHSLVI